MFRQFIAAAAVSLLATGAMAQTPTESGVVKEGTEPLSIIEANTPNQDYIDATDRRFTDYDRRFADYDARMVDVDRRLKALESRFENIQSGVEEAGTGGDSTIEANTPNSDRLAPQVTQ